MWDASIKPEDIALTDEDLALVDGWVPDEPFGKGHERQLRMIFEAIAGGRQPYVPGREAREAVDCILAVYEAAREGTTVYRD